MAINRLKIAQPEGDPKTVAFTDDILLNGLRGDGLITVTGNGQEKTVSTDASKLTLDEGNVKVATPLVLDVKTEAPSTTTNMLYAVKDGTENKLYWNGKLVDAHAEGEGYVLESTFTAHVNNSGDAKHVTATQLGQLAATDGKALATQEWASAAFADKGEFNTLSGNVGTLEGKVTAIEESYIKDIQDSSANEQVSVHFGKSLTPNTITTSVTVTTATQDSETKDLSGNGLVTGSQAQDAINAGVSKYNTDVIGVWSTISDKTVKTAIEENKAKIAALEGNHFIVVDTLPDVGQPNCIYLVPKQGHEEGNIKEEWIYVNDAWEKIGDTAVDLSEYAKTTVVQSMISNAVDAETTRATGVEEGLDSRLNDVEDKLTDLPEGTIKNAIDAAVALEATRATGVEGTLNSLTTDAKGNLVAAINEVDGNADAAKAAANAAQEAANNAQTTANARLASIAGAEAQGVKVEFSTSDAKAVSTTITVNESTLDANSKFATTDTAVATGAKVQVAIDAAEQRAKTAQTYKADNTTLQLSDKTFSAKTAAVTQSSTALTTGGQVYTAIDTAKTALTTALTGSGDVTGQDITIKGAMREAEAAQTAADNAQTAADNAQTDADNAQAAAQAAQSTADSALTTANNAVQTVNGDNTNIKAERSDSTVIIKPMGNLADLLSCLSISSE